MLQSKLVDIISVLDKKELKLLRKFVYSPVYNQHKGVTDLFDYLISVDKFTEENLSKPLVYKLLFPKSKYDDLKLRHLVSYLLKVCEECLTYIEFKNNSNQSQVNLLRAYRKRTLHKHFFNDFLLLKKNTRESAKKSSENYLAQAQIYQETFSNELGKGKEEIDFLLESDKALNFYFILLKLKNACKMLAFNRENKPVSQKLLPEILHFIEQEKLLNYPEIDAYYHALAALENPSITAYYNLFKEKLAAHTLRLELEEQKELFALGIQYCKNKILAGSSNFERELFEIYLYGLANETLLINQSLSFETQKNIIDIAIKLNEFAWLEDFILDSKQLTDKTYREELYQLNKAKLSFAKTNFKKCLDGLMSEKFKNGAILLEAQHLKINTMQALKMTAQLKVENQKLKELLAINS